MISDMKDITKALRYQCAMDNDCQSCVAYKYARYSPNGDCTEGVMLRAADLIDVLVSGGEK